MHLNILQEEKLMIIERIALKNYRQFRNVTIDLASSDYNRNFFVIVGESGAGKTNLLNAMMWCLYDDEPHLSKDSEQLSILNLGVVEESSNKDIHEVCVEIYFRTPDGTRIVFSRSKKFRLRIEDSGKPPEINSMAASKLKLIKERPGRDPEILEEPMYNVSGDVERLIPKEIREYFFFDGERIDRYFRETKKVKEPIYRLSRLDLLDKVKNHLDKTMTEFLRETRLAPEIEETRNEIEKRKKDIQNLEKLYEKIKEERAKAETKEEEYRGKLKSVDFIKHLVDERERLEEEIKDIDKSLKELESDKIKYILEIARIAYPLKAVEKTLELIKEKKEKKEIPPTIDSTFLKKLIEEEECICGRDLLKGTDEQKNIEKILDEISIISEIHEELMYTEFELNRLKKDLDAFNKRHGHINQKIIEMESKRDKNSRRLKDISDKLNQYEIEDIAEMEKEFMKYKKIKEDLIGRERMTSINLIKNKNELESLNKRLDEELRKQKRYQQLMIIKSFCEKGLEICNKTKEEIMIDIKNDIEAKTKEQFLKLIWRKETYGDVNIDDDYDIHVFHKMGYDSLGSVSAGEREALALSFMGAVHIVSGFDAPIVMDTPLARISGTPRGYIAENLPHYLEGKQIIFLLTDQEYTSDVKDRLAKRVAKEYTLQLSVHEKEVRVI